MRNCYPIQTHFTSKSIIDEKLLPYPNSLHFQVHNRWEIVTYPNSLHFRVHNRWEIVTYPNSLHIGVHNRWEIVTYPNSLHFRGVHNRWEIITYPNSLHFHFVTFVSVVVLRSHRPTHLDTLLVMTMLFFSPFLFLPSFLPMCIIVLQWKLDKFLHQN